VIVWHHLQNIGEKPMSYFYNKVDTCRRCGRLVDILAEDQYSAQGHFIATVYHRIRCREGCVGRVLDRHGPLVRGGLAERTSDGREGPPPGPR
jgi:hypothetical protein